MIYDLLKRSLPGNSADGIVQRKACFLENIHRQTAILKYMPSKFSVLQNNSFHKSPARHMKSSKRNFIQYHHERNPEPYLLKNKKLA